MSQFRFIEAPPNVWRVQRRGWFFWRYVVFFGTPVQWRYDTLWGFPLVGAFYSFPSLESAKRTTDEAAAHNAYKRIAY